MHSILNKIGNTPLVQSAVLTAPGKGKLFFKLEGNNPAGSVKDRAAYNMIKGALDSGKVKQGDTIIEATSGNTGIALAFISRLMNVKIILVMPENSTIERVKTMRAYGAKVILTSAEKGIEGSRDHAQHLVNNNGYFMLNQFANENNWKAHYKTTGPEIWRDTDGKITHFVSAMGTTGTIMGVSRFLKERNSKVEVIGAQPKDGAKIPGIRKWPQAYLPKIYQPERVDAIKEVTLEEATDSARYLAENEGVFAGMSSGGAFFVAKQVWESSNEDDVIVVIVCDRGDRYLSSNLFVN